MALLADIVLAVHFGIVIFIVGGLAAIWTGAIRGWRWIRNMHFRIAHLAAISMVALEGLLGMVCPLTAWEHALRGTTSQKSFIAHWLHELLYYDIPAPVFTAIYVLFAAVVAITFMFVPPHHRTRR